MPYEHGLEARWGKGKRKIYVGEETTKVSHFHCIYSWGWNMDRMQSITFNASAAIRFSATSDLTCLRYAFIKGKLQLFSGSPVRSLLSLFLGGTWRRCRYVDHHLFGPSYHLSKLWKSWSFYIRSLRKAFKWYILNGSLSLTCIWVCIILWYKNTFVWRLLQSALDKCVIVLYRGQGQKKSLRRHTH